MESIALLVSMNMISFALSQTSQSNYSSLFVASKAISTSNWETYKTESQPSNNLIQCLARCELHQSQWANGQAHPGYERKKDDLKDLSSTGATLLPLSPTFVRRPKWLFLRTYLPGNQRKTFSFARMMKGNWHARLWQIKTSWMIFKGFWKIIDFAKCLNTRGLTKTCRGGKGCCSREQPCGEVAA